jgi:transcriptional regulator with XRE-family HTH domain
MQKTTTEIMQDLGQRCRELRLAQNLSRAGLSTRSGVSISVIRLFEATGKISLESLVKLAVPLNAIADFECLFQAKAPESVSLDELIKRDKKRLRGRKS